MTKSFYAFEHDPKARVVRFVEPPRNDGWASRTVEIPTRDFVTATIIYDDVRVRNPNYYDYSGAKAAKGRRKSPPLQEEYFLRSNVFVKIDDKPVQIGGIPCLDSQTVLRERIANVRASYWAQNAQKTAQTASFTRGGRSNNRPRMPERHPVRTTAAKPGVVLDRINKHRGLG